MQNQLADLAHENLPKNAAFADECWQVLIDPWQLTGRGTQTVSMYDFKYKV